MAALWEVRERGPAAVEAVSAVSDLLTDADEEIPGEAALTLGAMGPDARAAIPQLREALGHRVAGARAGAAQALGQLATDSDVPAPELAILLRDTEPDVVTAAVGALSSYGHRAESTTPKLLDALTAALVNCDDAAVVQLVQTIRAVTADPGQAVRQHAGTRDPELQRMLFEALRAD
jgi:HEAT repeat protein